MATQKRKHANARRPQTSRDGRRFAWMMLMAVGLLVPSMGPTCLEESEPNDTPGEANPIRWGEFGQGAVDPMADGDFWRGTGEVGDLVFAFVDTQHSTMGTDSFLEIFAADGATLIEDDDNNGPGSISVVAGAVLPQSGDVFFRVSEDGANDVITRYDLHQVIVDPADSAHELEANDTPATANGIPAVITTATVTGADVDFFKFRAVVGSQLVVIMDDDPDKDGDLIDTELDILDTDGASILDAGDDNAVGNGNGAGAVSAPSTGTFFVSVSDGGGGGVDTEYRFVVLVNGVPYVDRDGDLIADTDDNCPANNNAGQLDTDGDGAGDACDDCMASIFKIDDPGDCGCGEPDVDIDGDGASDCGLADPALSLLSSVGLLLVPDIDNNRIMAFDPADGDLVDPDFIPSDAANLPEPIAAVLGPNQDTILVSDHQADVVQQFDLDGNYLGVFAPAGGVDLSILDGPTGLAWRTNGNLVVGVALGANGNAVAEFDSSGQFVGNFIDPGVGGLLDPRDILFRADGSVLVTGLSETIREYDADGAFVSDFATNPGTVALQLAEASDTNIYAAASFGTRRGVLDFQTDGTLVGRRAPLSICNFIGLAELTNGNWLVVGQPLATDAEEGIAFEMNTDGDILRTMLRGPNLRFVEWVLRDADGDGVGDALDQCDGEDDTIDADGNGTPDCVDAGGPGGEPGPIGEECCGGGMPMMMPFMLLGWTWARRKSRKPDQAH
ncbi:MAG: hypothetical protein MI923_06585 [Phycisphaerales bacterium]|nr:hypothetical protein [Phycisphaerales bacterium]